MKNRFTAFIAFLILISFAVSGSYAKDFNMKEFKSKLPALLGSNNAGTDFWVSFNVCYDQTGVANNNLYIYISSGVETTVTLDIPGKGYLRQQKTVPNDIIQFILSPAMGQCYRKTDRVPPEPDAIYYGNGVHIYADQPIIVYGVTRMAYCSDSYLAVPVSALGKDYVISSWPDIADNGIQYLPGETNIVSPYDNNKVRFTMGGTTGSQTAGGQKPGETRSYNLMKGDVLAIASLGQRSDISGSRVRSTKPVAVISGAYGAYVPEMTPYWDFLTEMELPTNTWGTVYHCTPFAGRLKNMLVRIYTKEAGTTIYRDGTQLATLKTGAGLRDDGWLNMRADVGAPRPITFSADKPFYIVEYNTGNNDDGRVVNTDPFIVVLTPIEQYQREIIFNSPGIKGGSGFANNWINLVYQATPDGGMPNDLEFATVSNGQFTWRRISDFDPIPGTPFAVPVNGKKYNMKTMKLASDGVYKIRANDPFAAYAYGASMDDSYGHPTSVALGDLEKPDTIPPDPTWLMECDGTIQDALVEDMPRNNDRSNMSMVIFDPEASYNYKFSYVDFIPGEDAFTHWNAYVYDKTKDARAVITFIDRRGNDTTIVIDYFAVKLTVRPSLDFGLLAKNDVKVMDCWVVNGSKQSDAKVTRLQLKDNNKGFQLLNISLPFIVPMNDSVKIQVQFTATANGEFKDSIGVGDTCIFAYKAQVKAAVGSALINVTYWDYGDVPVDQSANGNIEIRNLGSIDLLITGYTGPRQPTPVIFIPDLPTIDANNPLRVTPGQVYTYEVRFLPKDTIEYTDSMFFASNSVKDNTVDSVGDLRGRGIKPDLVANGYDWGRRRIDRPSFPAGPYDPDNGFEVIKLKNGGTMVVTIYNLITKSDINGSAFEFNRGLLQNIQIQPGDSIVVPVKFHPIVTGPHELILEYSNDAGVTTETILRGIGIVPQTITADVDFGSTVIQDFANPNTRQVRFTNKSPIDWAFGDSVTITDFLVQPNGNEIAEDLVSWGTEGFKYDKSALPFPIKLAQGEFIEFDAQFVADKVPQSRAALSTVSDAEADVTSNWTGVGVAQGIRVTADLIQTCVYHPEIISCVVYNTASSDLTVNSLVLQPLDQASQGEFEFVNPSDSAGFPLPANSQRTIQIRYKAIPGTPVQPLQTHRANLIAYNSSLFTPIAISETPVEGTCEHHILNTSLILAKEKTLIGDLVEGKIILQSGDDVALATITSLDIDIKYNGDFLKIDSNDVKIEGVMKNQFSIASMDINDVAGTVALKLTGSLFNYPAGGELLSFKIATYLPKGPDSTSPVTYTIATNEPCVDINTVPARIAISPTCVYDLRRIVMTKTNYGMKSINPNPVTGGKAAIEFSVGLKGYTEIKIYNSNSEIVSVPVKEELEPGLYKIDLDVTNMTNGAYWYEMTSGPFHSTEKMVIAR